MSDSSSEGGSVRVVMRSLHDHEEVDRKPFNTPEEAKAFVAGDPPAPDGFFWDMDEE